MRTKLVISSLLLASALGCSNAAPTNRAAKGNKITLKTFDQANEGFTYQGPPGWIDADINPDGRGYGKMLDKDLRQAGASELALGQIGDIRSSGDPTPREVLEFIKDAKIKEAKVPSRMVFTRDIFSFVKYKNMDCLRYSQQAKDNGALDKNGKASIIDIIGLTCLHPQNRFHFIDLEVSSRYSPSIAPIEVTEDAQIFFNTLTAETTII